MNPVLSARRMWWLPAALLVACGEPTEPGPGSQIPASIARVADIANTGNGSDLLVVLAPPADESGVQEYRLFVVPQVQTGGFDAAAAEGLAADRFTPVATGQSAPEVVLAASTVDIAGAPVVEGTAYQVFVLTVVSDGASPLSAASAAITLAVTDLVLTLTETIQAGSGGMAVDAAGNIYSADFGATLSGPPGTRVYKITPSGTVSVFASGLSGASGNAFDSQGNLFQSNISANRISKIDPDGVVTTFATDGLANPVGIAIDANDNLFVANCGDNTIRMIASDGTSTPFASSTLFSCPNGIALANDGNLYVANFSNGAVIRVAPNGAAAAFAQIPGGNNGHITYANGVLYVVARGANQIYELTLTGDLTLLAGTGARGLWDGAALAARLSLPNDIAVSPDGATLYFNDVVNLQGAQTISPVVIRRLVLEGI